jgi:hypothetical protein
MDGVVERKARGSHLTLTGKKEIDHRHKQKIEKAYVLQRMMQSEKQTKVNQNEKVQEV